MQEAREVVIVLTLLNCIIILIASLSPKSCTRIANVEISSDKAFKLLNDWKESGSPIYVLLRGTTVRLKFVGKLSLVSTREHSVVLTSNGTELALDLRDTPFDLEDAIEAPLEIRAEATAAFVQRLAFRAAVFVNAILVEGWQVVITDDIPDEIVH